jgi:integrase
VVALDTGARQGELFALEWSDWDAGRRELTINKSLRVTKDSRLEVKAPKTRKSRRKVQVSETTAAVLEAYRVGREWSGPLVFCDSEGGHLRKENYAKRHWAPALVRAGLLESTRFHDLRHTCATLLLLNGLNVRLVADRLGHASPTTTLKIYAHVLPEMNAEAARVMDGILGCSKIAVRASGGNNS